MQRLGWQEQERRLREHRASEARYARMRARMIGWALVVAGSIFAPCDMAIAAVACGVLGVCVLAASGEPEPGEPDYHEDH